MSFELQQSVEVVLPVDVYHSDRELFLDKVRHLAELGNTDIKMECIHMKTISSSHVSLLWEVLQICKEKNVTLKLQNVSDSVINVLRLLDIADFFPIDNEPSAQTTNNETKKITSIELPTIQFEFSPTTEEIVRCKFNIGNHLKDAFIPYEVSYEVETIFYEIATNIRLHGIETKKRMISFELSQVNNSIVMVLSDNCQPFDPTLFSPDYTPHSAIKKGMKNGLGIIMVSKMSDSIEYQRIGNRNILTIKKSWDS